MIVSIVDQGGARSSTNATAATVDGLLRTRTIDTPDEQRRDPSDAERGRALTEASNDRAHHRVDGGGDGEEKTDLGRGHAVRLQLQRDEQVHTAADETDEHDDRDAGEDELVTPHHTEDLSQRLSGHIRRIRRRNDEERRGHDRGREREHEKWSACLEAVGDDPGEDRADRESDTRDGRGCCESSRPGGRRRASWRAMTRPRPRARRTPCRSRYERPAATPNSFASPCPSVASVKRTAEAIVTCRAPKRSARMPRGSATTSAASDAAASIAPASTPESPNSSAYVGASGTIAIHVSVSSRNSA